MMEAQRIKDTTDPSHGLEINSSINPRYWESQESLKAVV